MREQSMDIVFATETGFVSDPRTGSSVHVAQGTHWPADDPVVRAYPSYFTDDPRRGLQSSRPLDADGNPIGVRRSVVHTETTSAEPGEHRTRRSPKK
jgi:hypothetical protein